MFIKILQADEWNSTEADDHQIGMTWDGPIVIKSEDPRVEQVVFASESKRYWFFTLENDVEVSSDLHISGEEYLDIEEVLSMEEYEEELNPPPPVPLPALVQRLVDIASDGAYHLATSEKEAKYLAGEIELAESYIRENLK